MTRIIAVANEKGGVGKTTTVLNLGAALAEIGRRILLIDLDPQGSLSAILRRVPEHAEVGAELLLDEDSRHFGRAVLAIDHNLWLIPATRALLNRPEPASTSASLRLQTALRRHKMPVDFVLIDTPPSVGWLTRIALLAAHDLLIPVQCQYMAMRGVRGILGAVQTVHQHGNPSLALLGVLATMYKTQSEASQQVVREMQQVFKERFLQTVIYEDEAVALAPASGRAVVTEQPWTQPASSFRWLAQEISDGRR